MLSCRITSYQQSERGQLTEITEKLQNYGIVWPGRSHCYIKILSRQLLLGRMAPVKLLTTATKLYTPREVRLDLCHMDWIICLLLDSKNKTCKKAVFSCTITRLQLLLFVYLFIILINKSLTPKRCQ